jgi:aminoglycoside 6'-N-acetyltransferase I
MTTISLRAATPADAEAWLAMRRELWPDHDRQELADAVARFFKGHEAHLLEVLLAVSGDRVIGFAEMNIRPYAEGAETDRVAYLEGWFVAADVRRSGVGAKLIAAAEAWARAQGCVDFASDALFENVVSEKAHKALGFTETEIIRCFYKRL